MKLHKKMQGTIAVAKAIAKFNELGCSVFTEFGDLSRIDLIVERGGRLRRVQVKSTDVDGEVVRLSLKKSGPNGYSYTYRETDFDYFVVYVRTLDKLLIVPSSVLRDNSNALVFRLSKAKNNQSKGVHLLLDYENFDLFLRDLTSSS